MHSKVPLAGMVLFIGLVFVLNVGELLAQTLDQRLPVRQPASPSVHAVQSGKEPRDPTDQPKEAVEVAQGAFFPGFFGIRWDQETGQCWLRLDHLDTSFLYVSSLATGLGSNPVGLDRGQLGESRMVRFHPVGKRVYLLQENLKYRAASSDNPSEKRAIEESFAPSVLWSGEIELGPANSQVVDITSFLLRDAHDCIGSLSASGQGAYSLDVDRSYVYHPRTKTFPDNTEFESVLTFASDKPGSLAERAAADGRSITLRQHHSFVRLPDDGYQPRKFDPRVGCFSVGYSDYAVPIDQPIEQRWITRHRLKKRDSQADSSEPVEPIVYYVDPGVPAPVRDALVEGASWWAEAFESAGFKNAFQVKVLPEAADPMDVRYNVIQWVHRATRGWSYGQSVIDPRTGEIIKGHVLLGSLRVRQDHLLFEGLSSHVQPASRRACSCGIAARPAEILLAQLAPHQSSLEVALARIRQLAAHEVGHTLGFSHNFAASTYGDRASVMDYPAPRAEIKNGQIDLSDAYGVGIGIWDKFCVQYAYSEFPDDQLDTALERLVGSAIEGRMLYVTDADARPAGAAHPAGSLWDNGADPIAALQHEAAVRRLAMDGFSAQVLTDGTALAELEKYFVPIYLHHRYQIDAAAKIIGGYEYSYAVKGDSQTPVNAVPQELQRRALEELLKTLEPVELVIPERILALLLPRVVRSASDRERFDSQTAPIFDPATAIRASATITIGNLLQPQRASRLARSQGDVDLLKVIDELIARTVTNRAPRRHDAREARRIVQTVLVDQLEILAFSLDASSDARAIAVDRLGRLAVILGSLDSTSDLWSAHAAALVARIERGLNRQAPELKPIPAAGLPPGSPIGF